jgi:catechol 2,3-dioxygenase-like lactoylglutathione lyase family enzyme
VRVASLDHLVLTVSDLEATVAFYERLGMRRETFGDGRIALQFGSQKLNLHEKGAEIAPHARQPTPGSADLCILVDGLDDVATELEAAGIAVELGPVERTGARGSIRSFYVRDPDGNLVELSARTGPR